MATVRKVETGGYEVRTRINGKPTDRRFKTKAEALDFVAKTEHDKRANGFYVDRKAGRIPVAEMAATWQASANHSANSRRNVAADLKNHILPAIGTKAVGDVTELDLRAMLQGLTNRRTGRPLAANSKARVWNTTHAIFKAAVAARRITAEVDPTRDMPSLGSAKRSTVVELTPEQVRAILEAIYPRHRAAVMLAAGAGLRISEVLGLRASAVKWLAREQEVTVDRQLCRVPGSVSLTMPKSKAARVVPVPGTVLAPVAAYMRDYGRGRVLDAVTGQEVSDLIFATGSGRPVDKATLLACFKRAAARAGVPAARFHDLRHFYAAALIDRGLSDREVGLRLGHSSMMVTRLYGHLLDKAADRTRHAIYDVLEASTMPGEATAEKSYTPARVVGLDNRRRL
jgi:integrase